jgi:hypothetical protein
MEKRPPGSVDWNGNGEYDFFDKATDFYIYKKVSEYDPEKEKSKSIRPEKTVHRQEVYHTSKEKSDDPVTDFIAYVFMIVILLIILFFIALIWVLLKSWVKH